jgi:hypothetical protein
VHRTAPCRNVPVTVTLYGTMKHGLRFTAGGIGGIAAGVLVWMQVVGLHPIFGQLALSGLISWFVAGIVAGAIAGAFAPHHKIIFALGVGILVTAVLVPFLFRNGWSHGARNPFLWYGPIALLPVGHAIGGFLARGLWRVV